MNISNSSRDTNWDAAYRPSIERSSVALMFTLSCNRPSRRVAFSSNWPRVSATVAFRTAMKPSADSAKPMSATKAGVAQAGLQDHGQEPGERRGCVAKDRCAGSYDDAEAETRGVSR